MFSLLVCLSALASAPPDIVLISIDTLRADRLGCYGHSGGLTPNIDAFAANARVFEDMICEEPQTGPSLISMFTSLYPRLTGTIRNSVPLAAGIPTVASLLHDAGYQTSAVVSNWNLKRKLSGLHVGFDTYDDEFGEGRWGREKPERTADEVSARALDLLRQRDPKRPLFLWVHYMDPHHPYLLHDAISPGIAALREMNTTDQARARYDSEVAYTDAQLAALLAAIPRENTFILVLADHGESLNEHGYMGHTRHLYQQTIHIPLMVAGPGVAPGRDAAPARGIDVAPTVLALAGLAPHEGMLGANLLDPAARREHVRVVETYGGDIPGTEKERARLDQRDPKRQAVLEDGWKLLTGSRPRLFHLPADAAERHDSASRHPDTLEKLRKHLDAWNHGVPRAVVTGAPLSADDRRALEATGYL